LRSAASPGHYVALQFMMWVTISPIIIFQILLCVREDQLDPVSSLHDTLPQD
jgi:hypothetical protein